MKRNYLKNEEVKKIKVSEVKVGTRFRKDYKNMKELTESIEQKGLINPITVRKTDKGFDLMAGGRRLRAAKTLGWDKVYARIYSKELTDLELRSIELEENLQRENLSWQEEVKLKKEIYDHYVEIYGKSKGGNQYTKDVEGISTAKMAKKLGESRHNFKLDMDLGKAIEHIPKLKDCKDKSDARKVLKSMTKDMTNRETANKYKKLRDSKKIERQKQDLIDAYVVKDVFDGLNDLKADTFNLLEVDPPYGIDLFSVKKEKGTKTITGGYKEVDRKKYRQFIAKLAKAMYRVMCDGSWLIFWFAYDYHNMIYEELIKAGFEGKAIPGFWIKPSGQTQQPSKYLASSLEPFFYLRKGRSLLSKPGKSNKFEYSPIPPARKIHPTERPAELITELLSVFGKEGDKVLVPFLGSGKTLHIARKMNMFSMGFDIDEKDTYKPAFINRVMKGIIE